MDSVKGTESFMLITTLIWQILMKNEMAILTLQAVGDFFCPPPLLWFFCNKSETRHYSDVKFRMASNEYLAHICAKF